MGRRSQLYPFPLVWRQDDLNVMLWFLVWIQHMGGHPYAPHCWCLDYLWMVFRGIVHLIWYLSGHHQVIESSGTHQGFSLPERGLNGGEPAPNDRADIWGRREGSDWLGSSTRPHNIELWTGKMPGCATRSWYLMGKVTHLCRV